MEGKLGTSLRLLLWHLEMMYHRPAIISEDWERRINNTIHQARNGVELLLDVLVLQNLICIQRAWAADSDNTPTLYLRAFCICILI